MACEHQQRQQRGVMWCGTGEMMYADSVIFKAGSGRPLCWGGASSVPLRSRVFFSGCEHQLTRVESGHRSCGDVQCHLR